MSDRFFTAFIFIPGQGSQRVQSLETGSIISGSWQPLLACSVCGAMMMNGDCSPSCPSKQVAADSTEPALPKQSRKRKIQ